MRLYHNNMLKEHKLITIQLTLIVKLPILYSQKHGVLIVMIKQRLLIQESLILLNRFYSKIIQIEICMLF